MIKLSQELEDQKKSAPRGRRGNRKKFPIYLETF